MSRAPLTREQALQQAQAEGLTLRTADTKSGYANVSVRAGRPEPYQAKVQHNGDTMTLGSFATAEGNLATVPSVGTRWHASVHYSPSEC